MTVPEDPQPSEKPKRTVRKRTAAKKTVEVEKQATPPTEDAAASAEPAPAAVHQRDILTLDARGEAETQAQMEDIIWHEIHNAYRTRRMLSGMLSGIERTEAGKTIAIVDYKGFRIVIPLKEMVLDFPADMYGADYIAKDEQARLLRLGGGQKISLLEKYDFTEQDAKELCQTAGLLSPVYEFTDRGGCWFCPNAKRKELRHLYDHHPDLWNRMLELQAIPGKVSEKFDRKRRFSDIDALFRQEDACNEAAGKAA